MRAAKSKKLESNGDIIRGHMPPAVVALVRYGKYKDLSPRVLAAKFGTTYGKIADIKLRRTFNQIGEDFKPTPLQIEEGLNWLKRHPDPKSESTKDLMAELAKQQSPKGTSTSIRSKAMINNELSRREIVELLASKNLTLPTPAAAAGAYVGYRQAGNLLFIAGQLPMKDGKIAYTGKVGRDLSVEEGALAAEQCALNLLGQLDQAVAGDWSKVKSVVRLNGFVNAPKSFTDHPEVINGASLLFVAVLGEAGKHSRIALGAGSLPRNAAVEIDAIIELR